MEYIFTLKYQLPEAAVRDDIVERLGAAGCDDALIGVGLPGRIALEFSREAGSAKAALFSALEDVKRAVPGAKLVEAAPDFVGLTDVADLVGMSRQNIRKLMVNHGPRSRRRYMKAAPPSGTWRICWAGFRPGVPTKLPHRWLMSRS